MKILELNGGLSEGDLTDLPRIAGDDKDQPETGERAPLFPHVETDEDGNEVWSFREQGGHA